MKPEAIIKALRCSATPGEHDCTGCPYLLKEKLNEELAEKFGCEEVESCDVDKIALDAAELLEAYRSTNHTPEECAAAFEELAAYRAAEQDGTLLRLPCRVGTPVFCVYSPKRPSNPDDKGKYFINHDGWVEKWLFGIKGLVAHIEWHGNEKADNFGKTVFLTLEAAEAALKKQEG